MMSLPVYNPNVPQPNGAGGIFGPSQVDFLKNFEALYNAFAVNHVTLDAASNAGNHTVIQLAEQTTQQQTNAGELSVYSKDVSGQTDQIFLGYQGNQPEFQFTNYQIYSIPPILNGANIVQTRYFSFLPGNLLVYFGYVTIASLDLQPYVAKNVVTAIFCNKDSSSAAPDVGLVLSGGVYTTINLNDPKKLPYYYLVMVNI